MTKPICLIRLPDQAVASTDLSEWMSKFEYHLKNEYHVICIPSNDEFELEVFYEKDFTDIKYQELKKLVEDYLTTANENTTN